MQYLEFGTERLENRRMMAGNVTVAVVNGDLRIDGDGASNDVTISRSGTDYRIEGFSNTTINGSSNPFNLPISSVTDDVVINFRGGDDNLVSFGLDVSDDLRVRMGSGDDSAFFDKLFSTVKVGGDANIGLGSGNDKLLFAQDVAADMRIASNSGDDLVQVVNNQVGDDARINTGGGDDSVILVRNQFNDLRVRLGGGDDNVASELVAANDARIAGGAGDDFWFDDDTTLVGLDLFRTAETSSIFATEIDDIDAKKLELILKYA